MQNNLNKLFASAIDIALNETDLTMQERVATGAVKVWDDTKQNAAYNVSDNDAHKLAFNAQKRDTLARNKRLNVQVDIPPSATYAHKDFKTFDNNVQRLKLTIINAPHLAKALTIVDTLLHDGIVKQSGLVLHKAMEAVGSGTGKTWEADKRATSEKSTTERDKREADKITADGFTKRLNALIDDAAEHNFELVDHKFVDGEAKSDPKSEIKAMPDAVIGDAGETVLDSDALQAMLDMPAFQGALMAAFKTVVKK